MIKRAGGVKMKFHINTLIATMIVAATGVQVQAATRPHSNTLRVETPAHFPVLAEENAQAMYLHKTGDGSALLYIEEQGGRGLSVLDVTDPAHVRRVAHTSLPSGSAFEFVRNVNDNVALIRYEDGSRVALLNMKNSRRPVLETAPALAEVAYSERIGQTGMLTTVAENSTARAADPTTYSVMDTANATGPELLATIPAVTERVVNGDTGTMFLLNRDGVTMVRRLRVEAEHQVELTQERGN
jgi:hypothetical protein